MENKFCELCGIEISDVEELKYFAGKVVCKTCLEQIEKICDNVFNKPVYD